MKRIVALILVLVLSLSVVACGEKEKAPIEKAQAKAVEIGKQFLDFEITAKEAQEKLDGILVPETEIGVASLRLRAEIAALRHALFYDDYAEIEEKVSSIENTDYLADEKRYDELVNGNK